MRLVGVVVIILCLGFWFSESIMGYWMAPAFQTQYWSHYFGLGLGDIAAGVCVGIALYAICKPRHYDYRYHAYHEGCSHHHNHGCGCH